MSIAPIVVRLFEPISLLFPENAMPSLRATVPTPSCILCDGPASPPSRMGWLQAPDRQAVFCVCGKCSDCSDTELEAKIVAQVSGEPAGPKAHISPPPMAEAIQAPPTWAARAADEMGGTPYSAAGGVSPSPPSAARRPPNPGRPQTARLELAGPSANLREAQSRRRCPHPLVDDRHRARPHAPLELGRGFPLSLSLPNIDTQLTPRRRRSGKQVPIRHTA